VVGLVAGYDVIDALATVASQPVNEGGQSPGAPRYKGPQVLAFVLLVNVKIGPHCVTIIILIG
jgi:hypothetical protein